MSFSYPVLPDGVDRVRVSDLRVGRAVVSLVVERYGDDVGINVVRREGEVGLVVVK